MTRSPDHNDLIDARLVAYLDNVLDETARVETMQSLQDNPELQKRLATLQRGGRDFKQAFEPLLTMAPDKRMQNMLAGLMAQSQPAKAADNVVPLGSKRSGIWSGLVKLAAAACLALAVFSGGVYTGVQTGLTPTIQKTKTGWRQAVAQYVSLYNKQTLQGLPVDQLAQDEGLSQVSKALNLPLTRKKTAIAQLVFKGTQLLQLNGKPLAQIAYLHNNQTPVALCILKSKKPASGQKTEQRLGLTIVHWVSGGYGYMLIGKIPQKELKKIAAPLEVHFS